MHSRKKYCLVYGQMSHWGLFLLSASNIILITTYLYKEVDISNKNLLTETPLNIDIVSIIYGSLLGDGHAEKRYSRTRFCFYQEGSHKEYILYLHNMVSSLGYCSINQPKIQTRLGNKGKIRKIIRFSTWSYSKFNGIYNDWYINKKRILPSNINDYLTPLALAIWIMDDGCKANNGLKLATNNFTYNENIILKEILINKYKLYVSINSVGKNQYNLYISPISMKLLYTIVKPYIIPSMIYKFGKTN